jgi:3-oxoacyl-[acyl-carrier protein] reductase
MSGGQRGQRESGGSGRTALVLGGTGAVGRVIVRQLVAAGVRTVFTYHRARELADTLGRELDARAFAVDLAEPAAAGALAQQLRDEGVVPDLLVHAAAISRTAALADLSDDDWDRCLAVNARSAFQIVRALAPDLTRAGGGDVVLLGGLVPGQSLPAPIAYAASQGALSALAMALAKELGPAGVRVNMVALGILGVGLTQDLETRRREEYQTFSALRRMGTPEEVAATVLWLGLENRYMTGRVVAANGGL